MADQNALQRRTHRASQDDDERELEELKARREEELQEQTKETQEDSEEPSGAEEASFKKRYGDLRRHSQKERGDLQKQIDDLKSKLDEARQAPPDASAIPVASDEDFAEWLSENRQVASAIERMISARVEEKLEKTNSKMKEYEDTLEETKLAQTVTKVRKIHSDVDSIFDSDEFHQWVESKAQWIQKTIYDDMVGREDVVCDILDLYKSSRPENKRSAKEDKSAADSVRTKTSSPPSTSKGVTYSESQIDRMSAKEYEKHAEDIKKAMKEDRFVYDLSA